MYNYDKNFYAGLSENTGFHKDTLEKVHRLVIILEYMNSHAELKNKLALKGGTCVNLTILNLARLSEKSKSLDFSEYPNLNKIQTLH